MKREPNFLEKVEILRNSYQMLGFWETVRDAAVYLLTLLRLDRFDAKYGTATSDWVAPVDAGIEDEAVLMAAYDYGPTPAKVMRHILSEVSPRLCRGTHRGLTYTTVMVNLRSLPRERGSPMKEYQGLSHTRWDCKYPRGIYTEAPEEANLRGDPASGGRGLAIRPIEAWDVGQPPWAAHDFYGAFEALTE